MLEDGLEALRFELVLNPDSGTGIAINSDGHPVEGVGTPLEHERRKISLLQRFRQRVCIALMLHRSHLKHQTRNAQRKRWREKAGCRVRRISGCDWCCRGNFRKLTSGRDLFDLLIAWAAQVMTREHNAGK